MRNIEKKNVRNFTADSDLFLSDSFYSIPIPNGVTLSEQPIYGSARTASFDDLAPLLTRPDDFQGDVLTEFSPIQTAPDGKRSVKYLQNLYLNDELVRRGTLIVGQTGAGKTQRFMTPLAASQIRNLNSSVVYLATKGDEVALIRELTERYRPGTTPKILNFTSAQRSNVGWNPFEPLPRDAQNREGRALEDAITFCESFEGHKSETQFWNENASRFIAALRLVLEKTEKRALPRALFELSELANARLRDWLLRYRSVKFVEGVLSYLVGDDLDQNAATVRATAQGYLKLFCDSELQAVTSVKSFDFNELFDKPTVFVLEVPQHCGFKYRPLLNLFFAALFREVSFRAEKEPRAKLPRPLSIYLDDFAACLGRIPGCSAFLNTSRSRDVRVVACLQETSQLAQFYGASEGSAILNALCNKIFTSEISPDDADYASRLSGVTTIDVAQTHRSNDSNTIDVSQTNAPTARAVLTPSDVRCSLRHPNFGSAATFFLPGYPPFQAWTTPAFESAELAAALERASRVGVVRVENSVKELGDELWNQYWGRRCTALGIEPPISESCKARIEKKRQIVGYETANAAAKGWWDKFELSSMDENVLQVLDNLVELNATVDDLYSAFLESETTSVQGVLHLLRYRRVVERSDKTRKAKNRPTSAQS